MSDAFVYYRDGELGPELVSMGYQRRPRQKGVYMLRMDRDVVKPFLSGERSISNYKLMVKNRTGWFEEVIHENELTLHQETFRMADMDQGGPGIVVDTKNRVVFLRGEPIYEGTSLGFLFFTAPHEQNTMLGYQRFEIQGLLEGVPLEAPEGEPNIDYSIWYNSPGPRMKVCWA